MTEENSLMSEDRFMGCVKWFDPRKGYGFINDLNSEDSYFVHYDGISVSDSNTYKKLFPGEYVSFNILTKNERKSCVDVRGINNGPLLTEGDFNIRLFPKRNNFNQSEDNMQ